MIEVKNLYKSFGNKEVLHDINTKFEDGKTNLIIGQSGAGKTVLVQCLVGLLEPTRGEVLYDGRNFVMMSKKEKILMRREMGMIFQGSAVTREIMLLEFSSSIMCLILAGKVGSNIASELGTMRVTQQIDALEIMGINSASYLILPKIAGLITIMPFLVVFSAAMGIVGAYATAYVAHIITPVDLTAGLQHDFNPWFMYMSITKSLFFAFIIASVSSFFGYTVKGGSVEVGTSSTNAVVSSSVLILFSDVFLTQLLS